MDGSGKVVSRVGSTSGHRVNMFGWMSTNIEPEAQRISAMGKWREWQSLFQKREGSTADHHPVFPPFKTRIHPRL